MTTPLVIEQGTSTTMSITYDSVGDLVASQWTARGQIRKHAGAPVYVDLAPTVTQSGTDLRITFTVSAAQSWAVRSDSQYSIKLDNGTSMPPVLRGPVTVIPGVTNP